MPDQTVVVSRVVLVGHCGLDSGSLRRAVAKSLPEIEVVQANRGKDLEALADGSSLLLVNRVLPGGFGSPSGVELIERLSCRDPGDRPVLMLVSNYADAQRQAEAAGALPGFGKSEMGSSQTAEKLRRAAGLLDGAVG